MNIVFDKLTENDIPKLMNLENLCFSKPWSKDSFYKELNNPLAYYIIAKNDNNLIGYIGMWKVIDEGHITNIAVYPDFRKKGLATMLLSNIYEFCKSSKIKILFLEVNVKNIPAINLYKKFGFHEVTIRKNYYNGTEDAIIMELDI